MDDYSKKYLLDVKNACEEVESFFQGKKLFANFQTDILRQRAVERNVEIMGEAINQLLKQDPTILLPNAKAIIVANICDGEGNLVYKGTSQNFCPMMATAADTVIVEPQEIVETGAIAPENVKTPGIFVDYIIKK